MKDKKGFFLVIEGVNFSGKSSLARELKTRLSARYGESNIIHKEDCFVNNNELQNNNTAFMEDVEKEELFLRHFTIAERLCNIDDYINQLKENKIIIQERNFLTSLVHNTDFKKIKNQEFIKNILKETIKPDCIALVSISDTALNYRIEQSNNINNETIDKIFKNKRDYLKLCDYADTILPNSNLDYFEANVRFLEKIVIENYS